MNTVQYAFLVPVFAGVFIFILIFGNYIFRKPIALRIGRVVSKSHKRSMNPNRLWALGFDRVLRVFGQLFDAFSVREKEKLQTKLMAAGFVERKHIVLFIAYKYMGSIAVCGFLFIFFFFFSDFKDKAMLIAAISGGLFFISTEYFVDHVAKKRMTSITESLPDCLDLMVVCAEAGLGLDAALKRVGSEIRSQSTALSQEMHNTVLELGFLPERKLALESLSARIDDPSVKILTNTLIQSEKYGTPLSDALRVIANELRDQRIVRAEEKAARLPAILTVPMIIFILPALFIVLAGPAFIEVYDSLK